MYRYLNLNDPRYKISVHDKNEDATMQTCDYPSYLVGKIAYNEDDAVMIEEAESVYLLKGFDRKEPPKATMSNFYGV